MADLATIACQTIEVTGDTIEERFRSAATAAKDHWLATTDDERFRSAVGAVLLSYDDGSPERSRIIEEMSQIRLMTAFLSSAHAGLSPTMPELNEDHEMIGLIRIWQEVTG